MFYLKKTMEISAAHKLELDYNSKCKRYHGHNFQIIIFCKSEKLNKNGMVIDFEVIKDRVNILDHSDLNAFIKQPTSENMAEYICKMVPKCYKVTVIESENNEITYERD